MLRELVMADLVQFEYPFLLPMMILLKLLGRAFVLDEHGVEALFIRELKNIPLEKAAESSLKSSPIGFLLRRIPGITGNSINRETSCKSLVGCVHLF